VHLGLFFLRIYFALQFSLLCGFAKKFQFVVKIFQLQILCSEISR
jgi:hypothetical protein